MLQPVDRRELRRVPDGRREEADRQVGAGAVQPDRVEAALRQPAGALLHHAHALPPRRLGVVGLEPADVRHRLPEPVERLAGGQIGVDRLRPVRSGRRRHAPVRGAQVDDLADLGQVREQVAARALGGDAVQRMRRLGAAQRDPGRMLVREVAEPVDHPGGNVVERLVRGREQPLPLEPLVRVEDVHVARAARVGSARDLARQLLLADVRRDADELAGLHVRAEADDQVGELPCQVDRGAHRAGD